MTTDLRPSPHEGNPVQPNPCHTARARRDIIRFRTTVIGVGSLGHVVEVDDRKTAVIYTVQFCLPNLRGATVTLSELTELDVQCGEGWASVPLEYVSPRR